MADYRAPLEDIRFVLKHVFNVEEFWQGLEGMGDMDIDTADAILEEAAKICEEVLAPLNREADEQGSQWSEGNVTSPEGFKDAYQTFCEGGWNGLGGNPEYDGMGMPKTLVAAVEEMLQGSCIAFGLAPMLTAGASFAINAHASDELKALYLPKMYSGEWAGAMDLTEPHAGTDLGLIRTKAQPQADGSYAITGTKIFITWGEHDMADNIVHLVLAKLPDAPAGSRGISLFLVPKVIPNADGSLGARNGVSCGSIEKKMGIKASATCVMNFDGAQGWLVGEPNKGLMAMFTMMNYERLMVGVQGISVAEASYQNAAEYAKERIQSRSPSGPQMPDKEADSLLVHPDVRRMLMTMRAYNEGGRAFYIYVARWLDTAKYGATEELRKHADNMVALLTPVAKAFMTDVAFDSAVMGQQVYGGHGYIREWGQEQHVRDIRITQIYEGTNGIQAMDLIGRKTLAVDGGLLALLAEEIRAYCASAGDDHSHLAEALLCALEGLEASTQHILSASKQDPNYPGAIACDYLHYVGYVAYGYMWLQMACAAKQSSSAQAQAKPALAEFFFAYLLPQVATLQQRIESGASSVMGLPMDAF
ncbi:acyl-CoA dehydrogenase C-terminal domain-containing protein [Saccharophagus degradans]|uniref:3-methylmercaptopropionyl-CoA dehydrogenase n=1 Tax=Saccharophagus degradans (strain 2-40 / ATCC 43961 / DSM 17024) TaxID=203122 RepID=Q21FZ0_SACD2|nr:acyl-CoA dehydrogenase C-terminal domain-containing protein [Saccharophagus degradans]ABD82389.1 acyl-CoA dehydrogenase-like protein [Saccharophagus degradans 2-40]